MSEMVDISGSSELKDGAMKMVAVNGQEILVAKIDGRYYAVDNTCPHLKGKLSEGTLEGFTVTCPKHGSQFDIRSGECLRWLKGSGVATNLAKIVKPSKPVRSYRTEMQGDRLHIEI